MRCPNCGAEAQASAADCSACGVIFSKFKKKLESLPEPSPAPYNPWLGRGIAAAIVLAWSIALGLYYRRAVADMPVSNPAGPGRRR